jgi:hypothetical protein
MKILSWAAIIIAIIVGVNEYGYIGETSLAWVIIGLAVATILNSIAILSKKSQM